MEPIQPPQAHPLAEVVLAVLIVASVLFGGMVATPRAAKRDAIATTPVALKPPLPSPTQPALTPRVPTPHIIEIPPADPNGRPAPLSATPVPGGATPTPGTLLEPVRPAMP